MSAGTAEYVKRSSSAPPGFFAAEAAGLAWLGQAHRLGGAPVVKVRGLGPGSITLERLAPVRPTPGDAHDFGVRLARTHAAGAAWFGCPPDGGSSDGFIGPAPLPHVESPGHADAASWGAFYAARRVLPYLSVARSSGHFDAREAEVVRQVADWLATADPRLCGPVEPVARIHGDLWSGNVVWTSCGGVLIDPAAHGGHRETDLAMLALFGLPHLDTVIAGYEEVNPLAAGWRKRVPVHQLHPLLVHTVLFGGGYAAQAVSAARACLALMT
jgi:fructosamine-3-kinase